MRKFSINESALSCYLREFAEGNNYEMPSEHQIAAVLRLLNYEPASPPPSATNALECQHKWNLWSGLCDLCGVPRNSVAPPSARPAERDEARLRSALEEISRLAHEAYDHPELANTHFMAIAVFADSQQPLKEAEIRRAKELAAAPKSSSLGEEKMNFEDCGEQSAPASRSQIKRQAVMQGKSMTEACKLAASAPDAGQPVITVSRGAAPGVGEPSWASAPASAAREWRVTQVHLTAHGKGSRLLCALPEELDEMLETYAARVAAEQTRQLREELAIVKQTAEEKIARAIRPGQTAWRNEYRARVAVESEREDALKVLRESEIDRAWDGDETLIAAVSIAANAIHYRNVTIKDLEQRAQAAEAERDEAKYELSEIRRKLNTVVGDVKQGISPMAQFAALATLIKAIAMEPTQK